MMQDCPKLNALTRLLLAFCAITVASAPLSGTACGLTKQTTQSCECCQAGSCCVDGSKTDPVSTQPLNTNTSSGKITFNVAPFPTAFAAYSAPQAPVFSIERVSLGRSPPDRTLLCTFLI
jgi:hypothetical protein